MAGFAAGRCSSHRRRTTNVPVVSHEYTALSNGSIGTPLRKWTSAYSRRTDGRCPIRRPDCLFFVHPAVIFMREQISVARRREMSDDKIARYQVDKVNVNTPSHSKHDFKTFL